MAANHHQRVPWSSHSVSSRGGVSSYHAAFSNSPTHPPLFGLGLQAFAHPPNAILEHRQCLCERSAVPKSHKETLAPDVEINSKLTGTFAPRYRCGGPSLAGSSSSSPAVQSTRAPANSSAAVGSTTAADCGCSCKVMSGHGAEPTPPLPPLPPPSSSSMTIGVSSVGSSVVAAGDCGAARVGSEAPWPAGGGEEGTGEDAGVGKGAGEDAGAGSLTLVLRCTRGSLRTRRGSGVGVAGGMGGWMEAGPVSIVEDGASAGGCGHAASGEGGDVPPSCGERRACFRRVCVGNSHYASIIRSTSCPAPVSLPNEAHHKRTQDAICWNTPHSRKLPNHGWLGRSQTGDVVTAPCFRRRRGECVVASTSLPPASRTRGARPAVSPVSLPLLPPPASASL